MFTGLFFLLASIQGIFLTNVSNLAFFLQIASEKAPSKEGDRKVYFLLNFSRYSVKHISLLGDLLYIKILKKRNN